MVRLDEQKPGEFTVCACCRLQRKGAHAGDLAKSIGDFLDDLQTSLCRSRRLQRMDIGKSRKCSDFLVDSRIVLHGAGTQRIESVVDAVSLMRQFRVVSAQVYFGHFRKVQFCFSEVFVRWCEDVDVALRKCAYASARS